MPEFLRAAATISWTIGPSLPGRPSVRHIDCSILPSYAQMLLEHVQGLTHEENERQLRIMAKRGLY
jgi:hypothetical protein